jgi:hypothetical protein
MAACKMHKVEKCDHKHCVSEALKKQTRETTPVFRGGKIAGTVADPPSKKSGK